MVIFAEDRFAARTAKACKELWDVEEITKRAANWPPGYDDLVANEINKLKAS